MVPLNLFIIMFVFPFIFHHKASIFRDVRTPVNVLPPSHRIIDTGVTNSSHQPNNEYSRPCLKDVFKDILLVIVYNSIVRQYISSGRSV